ncbi:hypothetical protein CCO03_14620 [Comamonas serinivorans]|uniref:L,D-transpeptidase n=2 Tax=Comamonas serinivorans TaxID=1082851 RepID=A0A1Y0ER75_9BURK|nr:hypothetical protein CCO03_14620 [Comamonas serinivorans]
MTATLEENALLRYPRAHRRFARGSMPIRFRTCVAWLSAVLASAAVAQVPEDIQRFALAAANARDVFAKPFAVIDKPRARLWVFDERGQLMRDSAVLVGAAAGDVAPDDIGTRPLSQVKPHEKITPAGRFVTEPGRNTKGEDVIWIDYDSAVSMHRVRNVPRENRTQRLATPTVSDNRISFGCVNIPVAFYEQVLMPHFGKQTGVVYVLPESQTREALYPFLRDSL